MAVLNWGDLTKSQDDPETIEQAIARIIAEHNANEEAHLAEGESLQSHKAAEIIDHLALSVITDKLSDRIVTPIKLNLSGRFQNVQLESLDCWVKILDGIGGSVNLESLGVVSLVTGDAIGNRTLMRADNTIYPGQFIKNPFFQIIVHDGGDEANDIGVSMFSDDPFDVNNSHFGIKYLKSTNKVYGFFGYYSLGSYYEISHELFVGAPYTQLWRAELIYNENFIKFYIDEVLVYIMDLSGHLTNPDSEYIFCFGAKKVVEVSTAAVWFMNPIWNQDL